MNNGNTGFRERIALLKGTLTIRRVEEQAPRWTKERRLRVALANHNGGSWWVVTAKPTVGDIEKKFWDGSVGRVLYRTVGGILGDHKMLKSGHKHYLYMQLSRVDADVRLCLHEIGVEILRPIEFADIRYY